jgi:hypothetical protein
MRQSEGFYRGAKVLPWKLSPLNYYYAFLNMAKAFEVLTGELPTVTTPGPRVIHHGVSARVIPATPDVWEVKVHADGVFPMFYRQSLGLSISPNTVFDARMLLGFSLPIGWQLRQCGHSADIKSFPAKWAMLTNGTNYWDVVALNSAATLGTLEPGFQAVYEEVDTQSARRLARSVLDLTASEASDFRFFQRRTVATSATVGTFDKSVLTSTLLQSLPHAVFEFLDDLDYQFVLSLPYAGQTPVPMNELAASYAIMFFLSGLVRYHPDYMDGISDSDDAWLVESFVKAAPITMLKQFIPRVLGISLVMKRL